MLKRPPQQNPSNFFLYFTVFNKTIFFRQTRTQTSRSLEQALSFKKKRTYMRKLLYEKKTSVGAVLLL